MEGEKRMKETRIKKKGMKAIRMNEFGNEN